MYLITTARGLSQNGILNMNKRTHTHERERKRESERERDGKQKIIKLYFNFKLIFLNVRP